jgi:hypothetical protein
MFQTNSALGILPFGVFPSGQVLTAFPPPANPPAVHPQVSLDGNHRAGPASRDFWALTLARVPRAVKAVSLNGHRLLPWASGPFQGGSPKASSAVPRRLLSRAWSNELARRLPKRPTPQSFTRPSASPAHRLELVKPPQRGNPLRVFTPALDPCT